jgi:L-ascorbate metabolism protein UlaG (beta-lactamase superfamily)
MTLSKGFKASIVLLLILGVSASASVLIFLNSQSASSIKLTLLNNAGVMIETEDTRIYIDPYQLPSNYSDYPADAILITHPHSDHYDPVSISEIKTSDTIFVFPKNMTAQISSYGGIGVNPGDNVMVGDISITAFYMYTLPVGEYPASHPAEANWTSYIIDIDGFTIFHAGDSKCIEEYEQIADKIDVALLPLGPGCQTMYRSEVVDALRIINPSYFIPIHYEEEERHTFTTIYDVQIEDLGITILNLDYFSSHTFNPVQASP